MQYLQFFHILVIRSMLDRNTIHLSQCLNHRILQMRIRELHQLSGLEASAFVRIKNSSNPPFRLDDCDRRAGCVYRRGVVCAHSDDDTGAASRCWFPAVATFAVPAASTSLPASFAVVRRSSQIVPCGCDFVGGDHGAGHWTGKDRNQFFKQLSCQQRGCTSLRRG